MSVVFEMKVTGAKHDAGLCHPGLNLLGHAQMIELAIGSECGGHGKCGRDRVQIREADRAKVNPPTAIEMAILGPGELQEGDRLACQCFPNREDLEITVRVLAAAGGPATPPR
jgi:ferredoxin